MENTQSDIASGLISTETSVTQNVTAQSVAVHSIVLPTHITVGEKPEKFNGTRFKKWQGKMHFYLTTLKLDRFLIESAPMLAPMDAHSIAAVDAWTQGDYLCRNYILNGLVDPLYNVYCVFKTSKLLWGSLKKKYKTEDAGSKKFVVGKFLDYKMIDSKTVVSQIQELQVIMHDIAVAE